MRWEQAYRQLETLLERAERKESNVETALVLMTWAYANVLEGNKTARSSGLERMKRAVALFRDTDLVSELAESLALAAWLHLSLGQVDAALDCSTKAVQLIPQLPIEPESVLFAHSRALQAAGHQAEAGDHLRRAYERVMLVAGKTQDEVLRRGWLENVWVNREILADWAARGLSQ